ncbi:MAG: PepSY domain-containing protein [Lachnospiraceae bacterium]|nr:PepSY domain-containing protein [Lachnospiraceae bacterium]
MINTDLEQKIRTAVEHAAPDQLDSILSSCDEQKGAINMTDNNKRTNRKNNHVKSRRKSVFSAMAAVAAVCLLFVISFPTIRGTFFSPDYSVVMLDVNPSLSMNVDENEKVLSVEALNDDAKEILGSMDLKGTSLETAVNAIIGSMLQKGYLSDIQNSILVSVENKDADRSAQLQEQVLQIISQAVANSSMDAAVLSQTISDDNADLTELAEKYNISLGKAALIQEVVNQKPGTTFESLASMSINEIALIISSNNVSADSVTQTGTASDKAYIGEENARTKACEHAGVAAGDVIKSEVKLDSEHGIMIYEVEFKTADMECEYEINACTGDVVDFEKEMINHTGDHHSLGASGSSQSAADTYIGNEKALNIALEHAGLSVSALTKKEIELDEEDGRMIYKVKLKSGKNEYEYEIDAVSGDILEAEID